jgi:hypothetical protein
MHHGQHTARPSLVAGDGGDSGPAVRQLAVDTGLSAWARDRGDIAELRRSIAS